MIFFSGRPILKQLFLLDGYVPPENPENIKLQDIKMPKDHIKKCEKLGNGKFGNVYWGNFFFFFFF